ncbi:MAG: hypothetical protein LBD96_11800, partial [Treponema sp.]|nr:hypothetical protein [Treponema sp.]
MKWGLVWCFVFFTSLLYAQTAREMDLLLETREVSFDQASRFVLVVANVMTNEGADTGTAYDLALERGWLPKNVEAGRPIRLGELCSLIMGAFEIKGSFLYTLFPGSRYAFRELDYLKLIPGQRDPALKVSGERFLQILGMVAAYTKVEEKAAEEEARRRAAAEEAQRLAAEEAQRLAAEEARRLAATEEARRLAAAEEARRLAAEEARRLAAAEEARRLAAADEAQRLAAAEEARRLAATEEARRRAAAEAARRFAAAEDAR